MINKILLLGSGELGKEFVIAAKRLGQYVVACDSYANAPAMQVADECEVFDMLDGTQLMSVVEKHKPNIIVPEIEAIRTECLYECEQKGIQVVPSAKAVNYTMNRKAIRDLAAKELGLRTAKYFYAKNLEELKENYAVAVQHMEAARIYQDSVLHNPQAREVCVLPALYEYELVQDNIVREKWIIYTLLTILWGFTLFYACHTFRLWRQMKRREWTLKYMHEVVYNLRRKLDQNDAEVEKYRDLYDSVSASSVEEKKILEDHLQQVVLESSWWTARSSKITTDFSDWLRKVQDDKNFKDESPLYTWFLLFRLKRKPAYIHDEDWEELYLTMDLLFDNFTKRLKVAYPDITESDLQYCCLFKAGFSIRQVAVMMGVAPTSVSRKKLKIREHMHLDKKMDVEKVCKKF